MGQSTSEGRTGFTASLKRVALRPTVLELCVLFVFMDIGIFVGLPRATATPVSIVAHCVLGIWFVWTRRRARKERASAPVR